ncbi:cell wall-binding repeat-containing protein [Herbiconiux sp. CPCC 205763]|uniref:Cell wall-binding repeat-containing protein n=1 Tax=Herbiconiux aconitum TaxID=2970913 RepID=A0ABT2GUZ1_9MICO|nr:cell wall-binding repeat-containing protein [Herbiconiux aconitum]MCS5720035.1 cell wall-binding repeat-containing protein [Herbiconiux aconitum]
MKARSMVAAAGITALLLLAAPVAADASVSVQGRSASPAPASANEVIATVQSEPYYYNSYETFIATPNNLPAPVTPVTTVLHVELSDAFLAGASDSLIWKALSVDALTGTSIIDREAKFVDIALPANFYDLASTAIWPGTLYLEVSSRARSTDRLPSVPARFTQDKAFGWTSTTDYVLKLQPAKADSESTVQIPMSNIHSPGPQLTRLYWATTEEGAVIDQTTTLRFVSPDPIWAASGPATAPSAYIQRPSLDWSDGYRVPTSERPSVSADNSSIAVPFSSVTGLDEPSIGGASMIQFTAGMANQYLEGTLATAVIPIGTNTSIASTRSTRLAGSDRYNGSIADAAVAFPERTRRVYLASGQVFADALSAGPAAVHNGAPLVLVAALDYASAYYLSWLQPEEIVVLGGQASTPDDVIADILREAKLDPDSYTLRRDAGADRYAASLAISASEFPDGAATAFLASGAGFADALTAIPAASREDAPVILIRGDQPRLDDATRDELDRLGVSKVVIAGGPASVSTGIEKQLAQLYPGNVTRFGGATRFDVAESLNAAYFPTATTAYVATGANFPDALTGGVLAGVKDAPLVLARTECIPASTWQRLAAWAPSKVTLLGGPNSLSPAMQSLPRCN